MAVVTGGCTMFGTAFLAARDRARGQCAHGNRTALLRGVLVVAGLLPQPALAQSPADTRAILERFADDFRSDPALTEAVEFGIRVDGEWWHVDARPASDSAPAYVAVREGRPQGTTFFFFMDGATLRRLDRGEWNARTAMGRARHGDPVPMDIDPTDPSFDWNDDAARRVDAVANHFWVRGQPELLRFGKEASRIIHGANAALLHYEHGMRSVWYQIDPGQHINRDPGDQVNPFPSLFIFLDGRARARIGGIDTELVGGTATLVPAGVAHELWNPFDEPFAFILIMFGDGA
jgi:mannose-6-phosphate isomerase-like protein (cupin superfamily)